MILHFLSCTGHGGDAISALRLAAAQRAHGYDARMMIGESSFSGAFVARAERAGVPVRELPELPFDRYLASHRLAELWPRFHGLHAALRREVPAVVHAHSYTLVLRPEYATAIRCSPATARIVKLCGPDPNEPRGRRQLCWNVMARTFHRVVLPTEAAREMHRTRGVPGSLLQVIPNGLDVEPFVRARLHRERVRAGLGIAADQELVLFLARLDRNKRPLDALRAFDAVSHRFPSAHLFFAGVGCQEESLRQYVRERGLEQRVTLAGFREDTAELMAAADLYVLPTEHESFGNTLLEAMAAGAAILTSDIAPLAGDVVPHECAAFVRPGDVETLTRELEALLGDPARRAAMGHAGLAAARRFDVRETSRRCIALYDDVRRATGLPPLVPGLRAREPREPVHSMMTAI